MLSLFFSPTGLISRPQYWLACGAYVLCYIALIYVVDLTSMTGFWLGFFFVPALFYSIYQVSKKRLHDMGYSARPFWMWFLLLIILFVGLALYFGWGEYFNVLFDNPEKHNDEAWIKMQEIKLQESLAIGREPTRLIMLIPSILFLIWLAVTPGKSDRT